MAVLVQNGALVSGPHYLEFDGVDDHLSVADAPALSFGTGSVDSAADDRNVAADRGAGQAS